MILQLHYFKDSGKFYSSGHLVVDETDYNKVIDKVKQLYKDKKLPDLVEGHSDFYVYMDSEEAYPVLIIPEK